MPRYVGFRQGAYHAVHDPAISVKEERRRSIDIVLRSDAVVLIEVYYGKLDPA
jgi:hypothetical protein